MPNHGYYGDELTRTETAAGQWTPTVGATALCVTAGEFAWSGVPSSADIAGPENTMTDYELLRRAERMLIRLSDCAAERMPNDLSLDIIQAQDAGYGAAAFRLAAMPQTR